MYWYDLLQSLISGVSWSTMQSTFLPNFSTFFRPFKLAFKFQVWTIYKIKWALLISLEILVKSFVSNIIIDLSNSFNKYTHYKHVSKLFEVGCLYQHTIIALHCFYRNEKLLCIFAYPSKKRTFCGAELNL